MDGDRGEGAGGVSDGLEPVSSGLERLLRDLGMPAAFDVAAVADEWEEVGGDHFANLSQPVSFGGGELVVEAADGAAASLLKFHVGGLIERLEERFGKGAVTTVRIKVGRGKKGL